MAKVSRLGHCLLQLWKRGFYWAAEALRVRGCIATMSGRYATGNVRENRRQLAEKVRDREAGLRDECLGNPQTLAAGWSFKRMSFSFVRKKREDGDPM